MSAIQLIRQGESLPFIFDLGGAPIDGWVCTILVHKFFADSPAIKRVVAPKGRSWPGFLTESETLGLDQNSKSLWHLTGLLVNDDTDQEIQIDRPFHVSKSFIQQKQIQPVSDLFILLQEEPVGMIELQQGDGKILLQESP